MIADLKPFQNTGAHFLAGRTRALLADEPGVGKTAQFITACNLVGARRVGVVAPSIGLEHWRREFDKWNFKGDRADIISWDDAHEQRDLFAQAGGPKRLPIQWDVLIPDEVHFGKNPQARRAKAVLGTGGLGWYARRVWAGSGTPAPNNAAELWPMLRAFGRTRMDYETFKNYFCVVDGLGKIRGNREDHIGELRGILKEFTLRRLKKDVLPELGPIDVQDWYVTPSARFTFDVSPDLAEERLRKVLQGASDDDVMAFLASRDEDFATLRRYNALLKAPAVFETVKFELENGLLDKVVIYGHHVDAMNALHREFGRAGIGSILISGDTPKGERDGLIEKWKRPDGPPVNISSILVAGTVLDYTAAHQVIALETDWVPGNNAQAWQRPHRHGQDKPVTVRVAVGTPIDEIVTGVLVRKTKAIDEIFS
jgi:SWI/SNF-related matrix-associated actin-dependent regulator of chromatin subfamily A-like protein 1